MIIRDLARRHGRQALSAPLQKSCLRAISFGQATTSAINLTSAAQPPERLSNRGPKAAPLLNSRNEQRWGVAAVPAPDALAEDYMAQSRLHKRTAHLGSVVEDRYRPGEILRNPPWPKDVTLELLMASQTHMGHHTSQWNPANARYIYGVRAGIHIISLEQTAAHLRRAARVVEEVAYRGGLILFVGNRKGQMETTVRAAELAEACHLYSRWSPGAITNRDKILRASAIKVVNEQDRELVGFDIHLRDRRPLLPDLVVLLNPLENFTLMHECSLAKIPTIGIIDTDADPTRVTYTIPANDDSLRSVAVIAGVLGRAGELGQKRRRKDAETGIVTWQTPPEIERFMDLELKEQLRGQGEQVAA